MASLRSLFLVLDSEGFGIFGGAMGTTLTSPVVDILAGTSPVHPASYTPQAGAGNFAIHSAMDPYPFPRKVRTVVTPVSVSRAQIVVVRAWLSMPKMVE